MKLAVLAVAALAVIGLVLFRAAHPAAPAFVVESPSPAAAPGGGGRRRAAPRATASAKAVVYVAGAVARPGVYALPRAERVDDAVRAAGGAVPGADLVALNLAAPLADGTEIVVRRIGESAPPAAHPRRAAQAPGTRPRRSRGGRTRVKAPPSAPVDINIARADEIATLPGIGMGLAERIVEFRDANGPFADVDDLLDVSGVTDRRLESISAYITVGD
jgi:competence protein ComEA